MPLNLRFWRVPRWQCPWGRWLTITLIIVLGITGCDAPEPVGISNYDILTDSSPMVTSIVQPPAHYQPVANWVGRLVLPQVEDVQKRQGDWVWFEVLHAPVQELIGQTVVLTWQSNADIDDYVSLVSRDLSFSPDAYGSERGGNVHPERLDGWQQVGPLQSLAGARPRDDVLVSLAGVRQQDNTLAINQEPTQVAERFYGLVNIESSTSGGASCSAVCQEFQVRHYNPDSQAFDGAADVIYLPEVPAINGIRQFSLEQLEQSPAGELGWYIYGSPNDQGQFIVRALAPRALFELVPDTTIADPDDGLNYINFGNWRRTSDRKGTIATVQLGQTDWREGDRGLVLHIFGGIGGEQAETPPVVGTVTGHFSYGIATVVRDAITQALRFDIDYHQVYAHNPNGIVSGRLSWAEYMGNLQRGWLGTRPVSDAIIKLNILTQDYGRSNPLTMLERQLQIMAARYRVGDGTGAAVVTPAQSCIQDSSQALYKTIKQIETQVRAQPPVDPQKLQPLALLGEKLENALVPVGIVRPDWQQNSEVLAGIRDQSLDNETNLTTQLLSWRTIIPRVAYDQLATIFFEQGATLRFLRTNQVGGNDPSILPLAPTELFGQYFFIPTAFSRLIEALRMPSIGDWLLTLTIAIGYGAIAIPLGMWGKLLSFQTILGSVRPGQLTLRLLQALIVPAILEELIFRVLLLPHPTEGVLTTTWILWVVLSLALFVLSHPLQAIIFRHHLASLFSRPLFIGLTALLGLSCVLIYRNTGSLWTVASFHWLVVASWLIFLGGWHRLRFRP
ncbi:MAG: CPBP family intramembrane metalloprotease [Leptolyngbyaceae cyanobacterium MAG.088]|nr:CPBP family intramembrane metalloprotease [Leptolyngbyaceae cyanobacterium MAG.088]